MMLNNGIKYTKWLSRDLKDLTPRESRTHTGTSEVYFWFRANSTWKKWSPHVNVKIDESKSSFWWVLRALTIAFSCQSFLRAQGEGHPHLSRDPGQSLLLICLLKFPILISQNHLPPTVEAFRLRRSSVGEVLWPPGMRKGRMLLGVRVLKKPGLKAAQNCL